MALEKRESRVFKPFTLVYYSIQIHFLISLAEITNYIYVI